MNYDQQKHFFDAILCETDLTPAVKKKGKIMEKLFYVMDKIDTFMKAPGEKYIPVDSKPDEKPGFLLATPSANSVRMQMSICLAVIVLSIALIVIL